MLTFLTEWGMRAYLNYTTWRHGEQVGSDADGNTYYRNKRKRPGGRERRWVVFKGGESEATRVPPEWHGWLHHQSKEPPTGQSRWRRDWQKPHEANLTGTDEAYRPPGDALKGGKRDRATGDYEPWIPT